MRNMINEAKSTKVLYYKEELDELYQYLNLIVYIKSKKGGSFFDLFYRERTPPIWIHNWKFLRHNRSAILEKRKGKKPFQYSLISKRHYQLDKKSKQIEKSQLSESNR